MLYFLCVSYSILKVCFILKVDYKTCKTLQKNDEIKACVVELETAFSRENLTKKLLYGSYMGFSGQTHMSMPISALKGTGVDILMWVYPEWSQMGHT